MHSSPALCKRAVYLSRVYSSRSPNVMQSPVSTHCPPASWPRIHAPSASSPVYLFFILASIRRSVYVYCTHLCHTCID
ncbi:hypothetical protein K438DRAFT_435506 [Mycena galopus ATCC 62051]|nr:hypothetical protein K438DRAFT_435506 [Mycena galopus ATCC 62051]